MKLLHIQYCIGMDHKRKPIFQSALINPNHIVNIDMQLAIVRLVTGMKYESIHDRSMELIFKEFVENAQ